MGALEAVRDEIAAMGVKAVAIPADVADPAQVQSLVEEVERQLGELDILVNNAGVEFTAAFDDFSVDRLEKSVQVNLLAPMILSRAVLPGMLARGQVAPSSGNLRRRNVGGASMTFSTTHRTACPRR